MFTGVFDDQGASNPELRQDLVACFHREAMHEGLCDSLSDRSVGGYLGEFCLPGAQ
jgi:hypothetical protein